MTRIRVLWQKHGLREHPIAYALVGLLTAIIGAGWATWLSPWPALLGVMCGAYGTLAGLALIQAVADSLRPEEWQDR